jgi:hypothetical protein
MMLRLLILAVATISAVNQPHCVASAAEVSIQNDLAEFNAGNVTRYSTRGHSRAGSIDLSIAYPNSWKSEDPGAGEAVRRFARQIGVTNYSFSIQVSDGKPAGASKQEIEAFFRSKTWGPAIAPPPCTILLQAPISFEGLPAGLVEYAQPIHNAGERPRHMRTWGVALVFDSRLVHLAASMSVPESLAREIEPRFEAVRPMFEKMFESVVLHNVAGAATTGTPFTRFPELERQLARSNAPRDEYRIRSSDPGVLWLVGALLVPWMLAAAPPLVFRFVIRNRRMTKGEALPWSLGFALLMTAVYIWVQSAYQVRQNNDSIVMNFYFFVGIMLMTQIFLTFGRSRRAEFEPSPQLGPQPAAPAFVAQAYPPGVAAPGHGVPPYGAPGYGAPQYGTPQYAAPQYGAPPYAMPAGVGPQAYSAPPGYGPQQPYAAPQSYGLPPAYGTPSPPAPYPASFPLPPATAAAPEHPSHQPPPQPAQPPRNPRPPGSS